MRGNLNNLTDNFFHSDILNDITLSLKQTFNDETIFIYLFCICSGKHYSTTTLFSFFYIYIKIKISLYRINDLES